MQDLSSFSLAQASLSVLAARKLGLTARQQEADKEPPPLKEWLSGQVKAYCFLSGGEFRNGFQDESHFRAQSVHTRRNRTF